MLQGQQALQVLRGLRVLLEQRAAQPAGVLLLPEPTELMGVTELTELTEPMEPRDQVALEALAEEWFS
jgi:hypothetical protein